MKKFAFLVMLILLAGEVSGQVPISETADVLDLGNGQKEMRVFSAPKYYRFYDGTLAEINHNVYTRQFPTDSGYTRGIWTDANMVEFPDSLNATRFVKVRDRDGNSFAFRPRGFVRRTLAGEIDIANIVPFENKGVSSAGNTLTYAWGTGSTLDITYSGGTLKQKLTISEIDRRKAIKLVPSASHVGIVYEYAAAGNKYHIDIDGGRAWTADTTGRFPVYDLLKQYNGNRYWLSGVTWSAFKDTLGHPGWIIIDPTIIIQPDAPTGKDGGVTNGSPTFNYGVGSPMNVEGSTTLVQEAYLQFETDTIPGASTIDAVICSLNVEGSAAAGGDNYRIRLVTSAWSEGTSNGAAPGSPIGDTLTYLNRPTKSSVSFYNFNRLNTSGKLNIQNDTLLTWVRGWYAGTITNYGFVIQSQDTISATRNYNQITTSDGAAENRPVLKITYTLLESVYAADSLAFSTITDSSAVLDSIAGNPLDASTVNTFAIYDTSMGMYLDTAQTIPFKKAKTTYIKSAWRAKTYPFPRNYTTRFKILSYAANGTDSLKIATYDKTIGTPESGTTATTTKGVIPKMSEEGVIFKMQGD